MSHNSRYLCATILALMLRYATFIQPPSIRTRDDHIVATLLALLKDNSSTSSSIRGNENKLRKRITAALGEIVFYITAQEEEHNTADDTQNSSNPPEKWLLPISTVDIFTKCLKDDSDEIVKHYAAKVRLFTA
jgi:hypothetical protein